MKQTNLEWLLTKGKESSTIAGVKFSEMLTSGRDMGDCYCEYLLWLASPHTEPITLTAEERHAAELAVAIGLPWIKHICDSTMTYKNTLISSGTGNMESFSVRDIPNIRILYEAEWVTIEPIDLRELLKEGNV